MRTAYFVLLLAALLAFARAFPGAKRGSSEEPAVIEDSKDGIVLVLPKLRRAGIFDDATSEDSSDAEDDDDDDEPASLPGSLWRPFRFDSGFYDFPMAGFKDMLDRIRSHVKEAMSGFKPGSLTPWGTIPDDANTTSTTKVIGNHAVTINETTYSNGDENGSTMFRVRIVDVKPLNETTDAVVPLSPSSSSSSSAGDAESVEEPSIKKDPEEPSSEQQTDDDDEEDNGRREELTTSTTKTTTTESSRSVETVEEYNNEIPKSQVETLIA